MNLPVTIVACGILGILLWAPINWNYWFHKSSSELQRKISENTTERDFYYNKRKQLQKKQRFDYHLVEYVTHNLGWETEGITVGVVYTLILVCSLALAFAVTILIGSFMAFPFLVIASVSVIFSILLIVSRRYRDTMIDAIIDMEDIICPVINMGVYEAIVSNKDNFHPILRKPVDDFIRNRTFKNLPLVDCVIVLNKQLGSQFTPFADKCITFIVNEREGLEDIFREIEDNNSMLRKINIKRRDKIALDNMDFMLAAGVVYIFLVMTCFMFDTVMDVWTSSLGKIVITIMISITAISFAYTQLKAGSFTGSEGD